MGRMVVEKPATRRPGKLPVGKISIGYSMLDARQWYCVNDDLFAVIPAKAGIQIFVILSEAKDMALGSYDYVAAKR